MKNSQCFIDTNIWLYRLFDDQKIELAERERKRNIAISITSNHGIIISTQVVNEVSANLLTESIQFQEAGDNHKWHPRFSRAQVARDRCLEIAVPWADLQMPPDYPLRLILVLSDRGSFSNYLPENALIPIEVP